MDLERNAPPKPERGAYDLDRKAKKNAHKAREAETMRWVKNVRDGGKCRVPRCRYKAIAIECAHVVHRGMGGNPKEDRTVTALLFAACKVHHGRYDRGDLDARPTTNDGMNGPADWYRRNKETGEMEHFASERTIGVSVAVGQ